MVKQMDDSEIFSKIYDCYSGKDKDTTVSDLYKKLSDPNFVYQGTLALSYAANRGDAESVKALLSIGADATWTSSSNNDNILHNMAYDSKCTPGNEKGLENTTLVLLDAGISALKKNGDGRTCVFIAAEKGNCAMISAFVGAKKKIDIPNNNGDTPLHTACSYANSAAESHFKYGLPKYEKRMSEEGLSEDNKKRAQEEYDQYKYDNDRFFLTVKYLIEGGAEPDRKNNYDVTAKEIAFNCMDPRIPALLNGTYSEGEVADAGKGMNLMQAVMRKDHAAMKSILSSGGDANEFHGGKEKEFEGIRLAGKLPLSIACVNADKDGITILLDHGADPSLRDSDDRIPLTYYHVSNSYPDHNVTVFESILKQMMGKGLDVNLAIDKEGNTLLNRACNSAKSQSDNTLDKLIQALIRLKADVNCADRNGVTPLMKTCAGVRESENTQITLLENGADISKRDDAGRTALMYAASNPSLSSGKTMAEMLFEFGDPVLDAVDGNGKNALEIAVDAKNDPLVNFILGKM